jgi:hypothetical protein
VVQPALAERDLSAAEAQKYEMEWRWDGEERQVYAKIKATLVVTEVVGNALHGAVVDETGNILKFYNEESVIMARFGTHDSFMGEWYLATRPVDGTFIVTLPEEISKWDYLKLWVNANDTEIISQISEDGQYSYRDTFNLTSTREHFEINPFFLMTPSEQATHDSNFSCYQPIIHVRTSTGYLIMAL